MKGSFLVAASLGSAVAACAAVPPLDHVKLVEIALASPNDMARYTQAGEFRSREEFRGASFSDGKGHVVVAFSSADYDAYRAYLHEHPDLVPPLHNELRQGWPVLRMAFQSNHVLFDPDAGSMPTVVLHLCSFDTGLPGFGMQEVMWRGRFVTPARAQEIEGLIETEGRAQTYEVFFSYVYWDRKQERPRGAPVTLLPLPDDLCVAIHRWNYPLPASVGRPLRIAKDTVNAAAGPLPRLLSLSGAESN